jgi:hypothetical protein
VLGEIFARQRRGPAAGEGVAGDDLVDVRPPGVFRFGRCGECLNTRAPIRRRR